LSHVGSVLFAAAFIRNFSSNQASNMAQKPTRYREVVVAGSPREMGRQLGEAARAEIRGFCEAALPLVNKTSAISRARALEIVRISLPLAERYAPDMVEELRGTAESARVSLDDLFLLQIRNQLQPAREAGCTSFSLAPQRTTEGHAIVAQNWDSDPALDPFTIVLTRRPTGKPALMTVTQAGLIAYIGMNSAGIAACLNTLPAPARIEGVPHYFTLRGIYEARSLDDAVYAVRRAPRAIPASIMLATPQGPANLEVTIDSVHVLQNEQLGCVTHTNHCVHEALTAINHQFPELIESHPRFSRINTLTQPPATRFSVADVQRLLTDHDNYPRSICRHPNDHPKHGFWETVFSVVMQPTLGWMYVSRGTPCSCRYERYEM
jgi:isopenicillin-N N-acyltransferase-like protein